MARGARISPAARRLAEQHGIDISTITGTGADNAIQLNDIERRIAELKIQATRAAGFDLAAMREAIAAAMARSKREIPHYYLAHEIEMSACEDWLTRTNAERPPEQRLLLGALLVKAVALAARKFPAFNGFYRDGKFKAEASVHIGTAIAIRGGGLIAPAIHDVDRLSLDELMMKMRELIERVRAGRIRSSEIADPTITVSSLGERGVDDPLRHHLSAPGRHRRLRQGRHSSLGRERQCGGAARGQCHACGRPPGERWTRGSPLPRRDRQAVAGARDAVSAVDIRAVVQEELGNIAPEMDVGAIDPSADLREALDIDSMDFLNFITAMHRRLGIDVPEDRLSQAHHA